MAKHFESLLAGLGDVDRQEIATIPERWVRRALDGDWEGVAALYHPDAIQLPPDQTAMEGREAIARNLAMTLGTEGGVRLEQFSVRIVEAEGIADLVYVRAVYRMKVVVAVDGGEHTIEQHGPYINILRRDDEGRWRIYRQIYGRDHPAPV